MPIPRIQQGVARPGNGFENARIEHFGRKPAGIGLRGLRIEMGEPFFEAFNGIDQRIDALILEKQARAIRDDRITHPAAAIGDDRPSGRVRFDRDDAEVLFRRKDQCAAFGVGATQPGEIEPFDDANVGTGPPGNVCRQFPVPTMIRGSPRRVNASATRSARL